VTRRRSRSTLAALLLALLLTTTAAAPLPRLGSADLLTHVAALTAPEMEGRGSGTPGGDRAARYVAEVLARAGLRPAATQARSSGVSVAGSGLRPGSVSIDGARGAALDAGAPGCRTAARPQEVSGGWSSSATTTTTSTRLDGSRSPCRVLRRRRAGPAVTAQQLIAARRAGARALLIVDDALPAVAATAAPVAILSGGITRAAASALLAGSGRSLDALAKPAPGTSRPRAVATGVQVRVRVDLATEERRVANVIGAVPGVDPGLAGEVGGLGAHYEHIGPGDAVYPAPTTAPPAPRWCWGWRRRWLRHGRRGRWCSRSSRARSWGCSARIIRCVIRRRCPSSAWSRW
jgi:hypothetical protein